MQWESWSCLVAEGRSVLRLTGGHVSLRLQPCTGFTGGTQVKKNYYHRLQKAYVGFWSPMGKRLLARCPDSIVRADLPLPPWSLNHLLHYIWLEMKTISCTCATTQLEEELWSCKRNLTTTPLRRCSDGSIMWPSLNRERFYLDLC